MQTLTLTHQQWQLVMAGVSLLPWRDANPLLMELTRQLQAQNAAPRGDGKEVDHVEQRDADAAATSH